MKRLFYKAEYAKAMVSKNIKFGASDFKELQKRFDQSVGEVDQEEMIMKNLIGRDQQPEEIPQDFDPVENLPDLMETPGESKLSIISRS
jgi:hypothetical protein